MQVQRDLLAKRAKKRWLGQKVAVLVDGPHPESPLLRVGRTYAQCPDIDGTVIINDWRKGAQAGRLYWVEITQVAGYDLIGTSLGPIDKAAPSKGSSSPSLAIAKSSKLGLVH
jgi:ribosomal protein S12 methylthiotransferase